MGKRRASFLSYKASFTFIVFVILVVFFSFFTPNHTFVGSNNIGALGKLIPDLGIISLGVGILMIAGEFDMSVASIIPVSSFVFINLLAWNVPLIITFILTLMVGIALGTINGFLVVKTGIPSFIATLGTMMFWKGVVFAASRMMPIGLRAYLEPGSTLENVLTGTIGGYFPLQFLWFLIISIVLLLFLHTHKFGNWIYVTGDNKNAARAMGINTDMVKIVSYVLVGFLCSFMSVMQTLRIESFTATQGSGYGLKAIASAVVGGTSLTGGVGSLPGILLGTLTIQILENGLILLGAPVFGINAFIGAGIVIFAILNVLAERFRTR